jgi:hypothetical protein
MLPGRFAAARKRGTKPRFSILYLKKTVPVWPGSFSSLR